MKEILLKKRKNIQFLYSYDIPVAKYMYTCIYHVILAMFSFTSSYFKMRAKVKSEKNVFCLRVKKIRFGFGLLL